MDRLSKRKVRRLNVPLVAVVPLSIIILLLIGGSRAHAQQQIPAGFDLDRIINLGWHLFFDPRLSKDGSTACATCHQPSRAFTDGLQLAIGTRERVIGNRNTPTIPYAANKRNGQFDDGRAKSVKDQFLMPLLNPAEMGNDSIQQVIDRLSQIGEYREAFAKAFGSPGITQSRLSYAGAHFQYTLSAYDAPIDKFLLGQKDHGMSAEDIEGWKTFVNKGCYLCHSLPDFRNDNYANNGFALRSRSTDLGRERFTRKQSDRRKHAVPTLRNLVLTAPYMHNGKLPTIEQAVRHYTRYGAYINGKNQLVRDKYTDPRVSRIELTEQDVKRLTGFLTRSTLSPTVPITMVAPPMYK